jgi:hypothetical protein
MWAKTSIAMMISHTATAAARAIHEAALVHGLTNGMTALECGWVEHVCVYASLSFLLCFVCLFVFVSFSPPLFLLLLALLLLDGSSCGAESGGCGALNKGGLPLFLVHRHAFPKPCLILYRSCCRIIMRRRDGTLVAVG